MVYRGNIEDKFPGLFHKIVAVSLRADPGYDCRGVATNIRNPRECNDVWAVRSYT